MDVPPNIRTRSNERPVRIAAAGAMTLAFVPAVHAIAWSRAFVRKHTCAAHSRQARQTPDQTSHENGPNHHSIIVGPRGGINRRLWRQGNYIILDVPPEVPRTGAEN